MIDINELRRKISSVDIVDHVDIHANVKPTLTELIGRIEAAEKDIALKERIIDSLGSELNAVANERDALRARIAEMERQEPVAKVRVHRTGGNAGLAWSVAPLNDFDSLPLMRDGDRLYTLPGAQPAPSVPECPYPCGWRNLLKHAIEDGAYLARSINEDEPVTENARAVTMRMVMRLRDVLMAINNAAPEAKP